VMMVVTMCQRSHSRRRIRACSADVKLLFSISVSGGIDCV
jgi:hypothetical protein